MDGRAGFAGRSLYQWSQFNWERHSFTLDFALINPGSYLAAKLTAEHGLGGPPDTHVAKVRDTQERFWACTQLIHDNPTSYPAIVTIPSAEGLIVIDGFHRLAALLVIGKEVGASLEVWIGRCG